MLKKTIVSSVITIALTLGAATSASALSVSIHTYEIIDSFAQSAGGTLTDNGTFGSMFSIDPFRAQHWTANAIAYFDTTGSSLTWAGTTVQGEYSYTFTLSEGQVAWGTLLTWSVNNDIPVLNIMDCGAGDVGDICTGIGTPMQTTPFEGSTIKFDGTVSPIPLPATLWLFGSGLLGLIGISRRKKSA